LLDFSPNLGEAALEISFVNNDVGGEDRDDQQIIHGNEDGGEDSERPDGHDARAEIGHEGDGCGDGGHEGGFGRSAPGQRHSLHSVVLDAFHCGCLLPGVGEHKHIVSCNSKHNEHKQVVEEIIECYLQDSFVDY